MAADGHWHPLVDGCPPEWASEWGEDRFGLFVGFRLGEVEQRMRWIPPGTFAMGSPENELGRFSDEGPQQSVTMSRGFWLAETPVAQALWWAVLGDNPSQFQDPTRPVESVSWNDGQRFCAMLNERVPGLNVNVPTEAQWEYACRSGTTHATYIGDLEGEQRSSVLEAIAWYEHNSDGETHPVKQKQPNRCGLYDMLGNVWEWCLDGQRRYGSEHQHEPVGPMHKGDFRVCRGGSWNLEARFVRAAFRYAALPSERLSDRGLRLVRDQPEPSAEVAGLPAGATT